MSIRSRQRVVEELALIQKRLSDLFRRAALGRNEHSGSSLEIRPRTNIYEDQDQDRSYARTARSGEEGLRPLLIRRPSYGAGGTKTAQRRPKVDDSLERAPQGLFRDFVLLTCRCGAERDWMSSDIWTRAICGSNRRIRLKCLRANSWKKCETEWRRMLFV